MSQWPHCLAILMVSWSGPSRLILARFAHEQHQLDRPQKLSCPLGAARCAEWLAHGSGVLCKSRCKLVSRPDVALKPSCSPADGAQFL